MRVLATLAVCCVTLAGAVGCGSSSDTDGVKEARQAAARQAHIAAVHREERGLRREARRFEARERRQDAIRQAKRQAARQHAREEAVQAAAEARHEAEAEESEEAGGEASECDPNYSGACLDPYASDYDCEGGSGDGPEYTGPVTVVGEDHYGLDLEEDGYACE
jgi:hypothetical protein